MNCSKILGIASSAFVCRLFAIRCALPQLTQRLYHVFFIRPMKRRAEL
jgi:hypothetical protein